MSARCGQIEAPNRIANFEIFKSAMVLFIQNPHSDKDCLTLFISEGEFTKPVLFHFSDSDRSGWR